MKTFLNDVQRTLDDNPGKVLINVDVPGWPTDIDHWLKNDTTLVVMKGDAMFNQRLKNSMPDMSWG